MKLIKILMSVLVLAVIIQFIPYGKDLTNPQVLSEPNWDSKETKVLFERACADCHSNVTKWPWYSKVAPISWLVYSDVQEGREYFNISMIGKQKKNKIANAADELEKGEMPPLIYIVNHPEANLNKEEKQKLLSGLKTTFKR